MDGVTGDAAPAVSATLNYLGPGSKRNWLYVARGGHLTQPSQPKGAQL
jgi:hypothetical protein